MNNKEWYFFNDKNDQGILSLNEVIEKFYDGSLHLLTPIRRSNWIYYRPLRECSEIIAHLKWDYIDKENGLQKNLFGYEIATKVLKGEISRKTLVKLEEGLLIAFDDSHLLSTIKDSYTGYSTIVYPVTARIEPVVIFCLTLLMSVWICFCLPFKASKELSLILLLGINTLIFFLYSYHTSKKGYSLYTKLLGLNLLNCDGSKLSVWKAFSRHSSTKTDIEKYDRDRGIILTKQKPKTS
ncbi:MAG: hypothetical protein ACK4HV_03345 [Parachlamydiaceae bacterium]